MSFLRNRSIGGKLAILVAIPLILMTGITVFNYTAFYSIDAHYTNAYERFGVYATKWTEVRTNFRAIQENIAKIILLDETQLDQIKELRDGIDARRRQNTEIIDDFRNMELSSREKALLERWDRARAVMLEAQDKVIAEGALGSAEPETVSYFFNEANDAVNEAADCVIEISNLLNEEAEREQDLTSQYSRSTAFTSAAIAVFATVITFVLGFSIASLITKPINRMKEKIVLFAGGDLTVEFKDEGRDAVAQMGVELDKMTETLRGVVNIIKGMGSDLNDGAQDFSAMAEQTSASVQEFRANIDEMSVNLSGLAASSQEVNASVEEVAAGAQTTAEKGTDIARKVDDATSAGETGMNAVQSVVEGIGRVAGSASAATSAIMELGTRARQIQNFVTQIGSIADQTNLLALNAAIEAARAGDAGRGFAVVAEEVRKLAEDSNVAAKNIADLASQITSEIDNIVTYAQENTSDSNKAKELSTETESAIANMMSYLKEIASSTQDLAAVAQEQAASSEEIAEAVQGMSAKINDTAAASDNIKTSVAEVSAASERVAEGSESISGLSVNLQEELSFFNVGNAKLSAKKPKSLPSSR